MLLTARIYRNYPYMIIIVIYNFRSFLISSLSSVVSFVLILGFAYNSINAQSEGYDSRRFQADIIIGANFSQLDGDGIAGFDKAGLKVGLDISYPLSETKGWTLGLYYDQRGSSTRLIRTNVFDQVISLQYVSMPISVYSKSWWYEDFDRHKIKVYGSLIPARLFLSSSDNPTFDNETDNFKKWDLSLLVGFSYAIGRKASIRLSGERSVLKIFNIPNSDESGLQSYQLNVSYAYSFN